MKDLQNICKIAVVQAEPVLFDKTACLNKALSLIKESTEHGARLVVFPELFIPGYPFGMNFGFRTGSRSQGGREDWKRYYDQSILLDGTEIELLADAAVKDGIYLSMGYSERDPVSGTLYNSNVMISPDRKIYNHRKLRPTGSERVIFTKYQRQC